MKTLIYITLIAVAAVSCSINRNYTMEDDIYYVPGKKSLAIKEVEKITGEPFEVSKQDDTYAYEDSRAMGSSVPPAAYREGQKVVNPRSGQVETVDMEALATEAQNRLASSDSIHETIYENAGYWIGGYKGPESDLDEIQHIINLYPNGFAFFNSNGFDIAMNLSFDSDWNVYTYDGRYWWFPSYSNINLYSSLLMGTYPKYIWTVIWDDPRFDSWAFDAGFNWGIHVGWNRWDLSFGWGWNYGWYDPWYRGWYDPWYYGWHHPWYGHWGWHHPHWHDHWHHPMYPGVDIRPQQPRPAGSRPSYGGGVFGIRPGTGSYTRPGTSRRPQTGNTRPSTNMQRPTRQPNTGSATRPSSNTGAQTRPGSTRPAVRPSGNTTTRPNTQGILRPGTTTRPQSTTRPTTPARNQSTTRPQTPTRSNSNRTTTRPATRTTTPARSTTRQSTRPTVRSYSRPTTNTRSTYNNNSTRRTYTPARSTNNSRPSYTPQRSNRSTYTPTRTPSRSGGASRPAPTRPTRR